MNPRPIELGVFERVGGADILVENTQGQDGLRGVEQIVHGYEKRLEKCLE